MSLYPSLEDMKVDQMVKAQMQYENIEVGQEVTSSGALYPTLGSFMGLEMTEEMLAPYIPPGEALIPYQQQNNPSSMVAPLSSQSLAFQKTQVTHGIRQLTLCKDKDGKIGLRLRAVNNGLFVCLVIKDSPAALVGLRFGDQILQINGEDCAGMSMDKGHNILKKAPINGIQIVVRDRPFERTVVLHKNSVNHVGFQFKNGKITALVKDSSAARNGLLTDHQLLEVNGQNVVGLKDKEIAAIIEAPDNPIVTLTIIPYCIYQHMVSKMAGSLLTSIMDHSMPTF